MPGNPDTPMGSRQSRNLATVLVYLLLTSKQVGGHPFPGKSPIFQLEEGTSGFSPLYPAPWRTTLPSTPSSGTMLGNWNNIQVPEVVPNLAPL